MSTRRRTGATGATAAESNDDQTPKHAQTLAAGAQVSGQERRGAPSEPHARLRVATLNTRFVLDKYRAGRLRLLKDTIHGMIYDGKRHVEDVPPATDAGREWPVVLGLQEACVSPGRGVTCLPASVPQPRRTPCLPRCLPSCCCDCRAASRGGRKRHAVHTLPHVLAYARQFRVLRWLLSLFFVRWVLDAFAVFNEWLLEHIIGRWGQTVFYHPVGKYLYMILGSAFVFGNAIVTHVPSGLGVATSDGASQSGTEAASPHIVSHHELTVGDFRAVHAVTLRLPCDPSAAGAGRPSRYPWSSSHPSARRNSRCSSVSTPSAATTMRSWCACA